MGLHQKLARILLACGTACAFGAVVGAGVGVLPGTLQAAFAQAADEGSTEDVLIFKNGTRVTGTIVSETATTIKFKSSAGGIAFETEYQKSEIIEIKRATKKPESTTPAATTPAATTPAATTPALAPGATASATTPAADANPNATKVYFIPIKGIFGEDVSQAPIEQALRDAQKAGASVIVLEVDSASADQRDPRTGEGYPPDLTAWNETGRVEQIFPVFTDKLPAFWPTNPPRIVVVIKRAWNGAAFFPFMFQEIYFTPSGTWGGIGMLSQLFDGVGDPEVREKQRSLRLGHVAGWAAYGKHDEIIVRAMSRSECVLTMKMVGGKPQLFERMPEDPSEELLTDDGEGANADTVENYFAGTGNDVLNLNARNALLLGISKGTVENTDQLLSFLGVPRDAVLIRDRGERIMKNWSRGMDGAQRQLQTLFREYREIRVEPPGDYDARTKARGQQLNKLRQMKSLIARYDEGLEAWAGRNMPGIPQIETRIKEIELEQALDRRD